MSNKTPQNKKFWEFKNFTDTSADLYVYGEISEYSWCGDEITPKQFSEDLESVKNVDILNIRINSVGGDVFAAHAIYSLLKSHKAQKIVYIDGLAASAATIIMMSGDKICMPPNAMIMIHNPWTCAIGEAKDLQKSIEVLDKVKDSIILAYQAKTGLDYDELSALMDEETWMTGKEAFEKGFIDELIEDVQVAASINNNSMIVNGITFDMEKFINKENLLNKFSNIEDNPIDRDQHLENIISQFTRGIKDLFRSPNSKGARIEKAKDQMKQLSETLNSFDKNVPNALNDLFKETFKNFIEKEEAELEPVLDNKAIENKEAVENTSVEKPEEEVKNFITEEKVLEIVTNEINKAKEEITNSLKLSIEDSTKNNFEDLTNSLSNTFKDKLEEIINPVKDKISEIENLATGSKGIEGQEVIKVTNKQEDGNSDMWSGLFKNAIPSHILAANDYNESEEE